MTEAQRPTDTTDPRREILNAIARALCDQAEAAEVNGSDPWWGLSTDDVSELITDAVLPNLLAARRTEAETKAAELEDSAAILSMLEPALATVSELIEHMRARARSYRAAALLAQPDPELQANAKSGLDLKLEHRHEWSEIGVCDGCDSYDRSQDQVLNREAAARSALAQPEPAEERNR